VLPGLLQTATGGVMGDLEGFFGEEVVQDFGFWWF
jgi:hypothetical protein